ncbi:MAG: Ig-like domain-containing protein [Candidatus Riflebacteria bacterium]|nr:Ig-like domain-containing protein [Candidatus Riflebacteria bacterium]
MINNRDGIIFLAVFLLLSIILSGCTNANSIVSNPVATNDTQYLTQTDTAAYSGTGTSLGTETYFYPGTGAASSGNTLLSQNQAPVISLRASQNVVGFSGVLTVTAEAIDPDGDPVYYSWFASQGVFISQLSNTATWKAPDQNIETVILCNVEDRKGGFSTAKVNVSVVGGRSYRISASVSRTSLNSGIEGEGLTSEWAPLSQARVLLSALNQVAITDQNGIAEFNLDSGNKLASSSDVVIQYVDWEIKYKTDFKSTSLVCSDQLQFYPGFDGVTIAMGKGDSFQSKRGGIEVNAFENNTGLSKAISEFSVTAGTAEATGNGGLAFFSSSPGYGQVSLSIDKDGYSKLSGVSIPVSLDGVTLVNSSLLPANKVSSTEAFVSWSKPYRGQKAVSIAGPFEIGFGQAMEQATIFDDFQMTIQDTTVGSSLVLNGALMKEKFTLKWLSPSVLNLIPKDTLNPLRRYSLLINRWNARTLDGRLLKSYSGMFGTFTTDSDDYPSISSVSPKNGQSAISRSGPFEIRFDRSMNPATLKTSLEIEISDMEKGSKIKINGNNLESEFSVLWRENNTLLSLVPRRTLSANRSYMIRLINCGLKSSTGKQLEGYTQLWSQFTTGEL